MKKIIDIQTREEVKLTKEDLPILIHGKEHSGASLLSVTVAAALHKIGSKLCMFTAYPMAKDEFLKQVENPEAIFYLEYEENIEESLGFQTIIVQSGNLDLFTKIISNYNLRDRVIFIKNIETISKPILELVKSHILIVSGDLDINPVQLDFKNISYNTKFFTSSMLGENIPILEKYQAFMKSRSAEKIVAVGE